MKNKGRGDKKVEKKQGGITLIALVITIIVLLILAGISISTLTGNNGILKQAQEAKMQTEKSSLIELIQIDIVEAQTNTNGDITKKQVKDILDEYFNNVPEELPDSIVDLELIAKDEYGGYKIMGSEIYSGDLSEKIEPGSTLAEKITSINYGDYINYNVDLSIDGDQDGDTTDIDDWRVFYKDENGNVFIIAADYVPTTNPILDNALNQIGIINIGKTYPIRWSLNNSTASEIDTNVSNLFKFGFNYSNALSNYNMRLTSKLLDTNIWSGFAIGAKGATAIGGPTLEMYMSSWNEKGYTKLYCNNSTNEGYYIGTSDSPTDSYISIKSDVNGYGDTLYYPHKSKYDNSCFGYWLVAPSVNDQEESAREQYAIDCTGEVLSVLYHTDWYAVRPLVCLPSGTQGTQDENGTWQIQQ